MARFQRSLRPINRIKHVYDLQGGSAIGADTKIVFAKAVDAPVLANTNEVETGSTINGVFISCEANVTSSAALPNAYFMIVKNVGNNLTFPSGNAVGASDNKRYVLHQEMVMFQGQTGSNPRTLFKGVIKIPKGFRRMGPDDRLECYILFLGVNGQFCAQFHYKEFR